MKPEGSMFPSHATMYWAGVTNEEDREGKVSEYRGSMSEWQKFSREMKEFYNLDMGALGPSFEKEQGDYYIYSSLWTELQTEHVIGQPVVIKRMNLNTCTLEDALGVSTTPFEIIVPFPVRISGFAGWFSVDFNGSVATPCVRRVTLSTGPEVGYTHWGQQVIRRSLPLYDFCDFIKCHTFLCQNVSSIFTCASLTHHATCFEQVFYLKDPIDCSGEMRLHGDVTLVRQEKNKRLYNMKINYAADDAEPASGIYEIP